jgi:hypothetical protein
MNITRKITAAAVMTLGLAASAAPAHAGSCWWTKQLVNQVLVLDSDVGPICQVNLGDNTNWAFKVAGHEKMVDLLESATVSGKTVYLNYSCQGNTTPVPAAASTTFTPVNGGTQSFPQPSGVSLTR